MTKLQLKDVQGRWRTRSLFVEETTTPDIDTLWCLREGSWKGKPSMKDLYMDMQDPTEYKFAMATLGSWDHWKVLCNTKWFSVIIEEWRDELATKLRATAIDTIKNISKDTDDTRALQAARYLADKGWVDKQNQGRPSKEVVEGTKKRLAQKASVMDEHAERIGLDVTVN